MSIELKEVKNRIRSTREIRRVTGTLQRVASARLARDRALVETSRRYLEELGALVAEAAAAVSNPGHPLLARRDAAGDGRIGVVVFGADRGLCGGFTVGLLSALELFAAGQAPGDLRAVCVGRLTERRVRRAGVPIERSYRQPSLLRTDGIDAIIAAVVDMFQRGALREVHVLCMRFVSGVRQEAEIRRVLPAGVAAVPNGGQEAPRFEPSAEALLEALLPEWVRQSLYDAFVNSAASEDAARQLAMSRATQNADDMLGNLLVDYSRLRQQGITTEMLELYGGMG